MPSTTPGTPELSQIIASIPAPASAAPPSVADTSTKGAMASQFAMADHTHASKARRERLQCAADGTLTWTFNPPFDVGAVPRVQAIAEVTFGTTDVVNAQIDGTPTNTEVKIRVTRTNRSTVALLGLTILSLPTQPGVTWVHMSAVAP